jgi:PHD/YefM family antitoxin component YafN of YafNO toxin-antitoxin module
MLALDYRKCGKQGKPCVVYVDQEDDYRFMPEAEAALLHRLAAVTGIS